MMGKFVSLEGAFDNPVAQQRQRQPDKARTKQHRPQNLKCLPMEQLCHVEFRDLEIRWKLMWVAQNPISELIFPSENHRPDGEENIVKGDCDHRRQLAASEKPSCQYGEKRFQASQRCEAPKDPDSDAACDSVGRIPHLVELSPRISDEFLGIETNFHDVSCIVSCSRVGCEQDPNDVH